MANVKKLEIFKQSFKLSPVRSAKYFSKKQSLIKISSVHPYFQEFPNLHERVSDDEYKEYLEMKYPDQSRLSDNECKIKYEYNCLLIHSN